MTLSNLTLFLSKFSVSEVALAVATIALTGIIKTIVFKGKKHKLTTFIPFISGIVLSYAYYLLFGKSADHEQIISSGITVGGISTVIYVFYAQFVKYGSLEGVTIEQLTAESVLAGYVADDSLQAAAEDALKTYAAAEKSPDSRFNAVNAYLKQLLPDVSEGERQLLAKALVNCLSALE